MKCALGLLVATVCLGCQAQIGPAARDRGDASPIGPPTDGSALPSDGSAPASEGGAPPSDGGALPGDGGALAHDGGPLPGEGGAIHTP